MDLILIVVGIILAAVGLTRKDKKGKRTPQGKKIAIAGAVVLAIGIVWFIVGFTLGFNNAMNMYNQQQTEEVVTEETTTAYPQEVIDGFVSSCVTSSGLGENARNYCTCAAEAVQANYSLEEFVALGNQINETGQTPAELTEVIASCTSELQ